MTTSNSQTTAAMQYLNAVAAPPNLTPQQGSLESDPNTGAYIRNSESNQSNVLGTNTGSFTSYVGGSGLVSPAYTMLLNGIFRSFSSGLGNGVIEKYFNSLTTANANALQYTTQGTASPLIPGVYTSNPALKNQALISTTNPQTNALAFGSTLPSSFSDFASSLLSFVQTQSPGATMVTSTGATTTDPTKTPMYQTFLDIFEQYTQSNTDWSILGASGTNTTLVESQFQAAFSAFLKNFPSAQIENLQADGTYNLVSTSDFLTTWLNFSTATSTVQSSTQNQSAAVGSDPNANQYLLNYQAIYKAFFPNSITQDFQTFFTNFYNQTVSNQGYFLPSQFVGNFFAAVQKKYAAPFLGQASGFNLTQPTLSIIWEVLSRLQQMNNIIQQLSVYVSNYLSFLTRYQKAYTNLIADIPTFAANTPIVGDNVDTRNQQLSNYRTTLSSYRDQITATSKGVQSYLDTLSQASSNTLNQGGALLTMLNGLLTIIHAS